MPKKRNRPGVFISPAFMIAAASLAVVLILVALLAKWSVGQVWPLVLVLTGMAGVISSLGSKGKVATGYLISSMVFILLGLVFSQFSFGIVPGSFGKFVLMWWPSFLVAGIVCLLSAYGYSRYRRNKSGRPTGP